MSRCTPELERARASLKALCSELEPALAKGFLNQNGVRVCKFYMCMLDLMAAYYTLSGYMRSVTVQRQIVFHTGCYPQIDTLIDLLNELSEEEKIRINKG